MADYLDAFARESEEQITELNNALLEFEDDPSDEAAMDQIFRTAHTLKGNCGAMGFDRAEDLAHAIEDLLEAIRSNRVSVTPELMDAVFDGVDALEAMIEEAVQHGEIRRDADAELEALRAYAEAEGIAEPTDAEIDDLIEAVSAPSDDEHSVYHVRLDVAGDPAVHGRAVVDALDDAFELLGTDPEGDIIDAGDYDGTIDAAFASVVQRAAVEAALEPVDAVADQVITDVTDRVDDEPEDPVDDATAASAAPDDGTTEADPDDLSVDELLEDEEVDQFDDLDEMAEDVGDTSEFDDLGDAGSFADLGISEDDVEIETAADAADIGEEAATSPEEAPSDDAATAEPTDPEDEEVEDAAAEFAQLKEEVDPVGFDELQDELADLEFDEYDSDEEVGFDELLDEDELEDEGAFAESAVTAGAAADAGGETADGETGDVETADDAAPSASDDEPPAADDEAADATAEDLFGGGEEPAEVDTVEPADADPQATAEADDSAVVDGTEATEADESAEPVLGEDLDAEESVSTDEGAPMDEGTSVDEGASADDTATGDDAATADEGVPTDEDAAGDAVANDAVTADDTDSDAFDASEVLETESLEESAESFGEGGLDLSEESDDESVDEASHEEVPANADELDLDDSFGEMEADAAAEADAEAAEADAEAAEAEDDVELGEDDIDFGDGTVAGAEDTPEETDEGVAVGDAMEDDSFDPDAADSLEADAGASVDESEAESVEGFGDADDSVLDLDDSSAAPSETSAEGDDATLDSVDAPEVGSAPEEIDDEETELEEAGATADSTDDSTTPTDSAVDAGLDDPGFSDAPSTDEDDGPDVDEERLERIRSLGVPQRDPDAEGRSAGTQSIRVDVEALDRMLNMVEGLVTSRARLRRALIENEPREVLEDELDDLEDVTSELQDTVMDVRLVPLRTAVNKLPRIVRDVAREEDKQVDFEMVGEDVELDRSILDEIGDPLVHLVRNAVDHGIETPKVREEAGKPAEGSIELRATRERDRVTVTVEDDGAGIDADAVRDAAVEEGIHTRSEVDSMDDEDVYELIFHSGFSTAAEVTDVSGRGVGMDVVAETVERLDGTVTVDSEPGEGTTITMELPVTLAIAEILFVDVGGEEYGIPIKTVDEIGPVVDVETQDGQEVLVSDGGEDQRELIRLDEALSTPGRSDPNSGMLVHLREDVREAAIHCKQVREQQEVVVKPFEGVLGDVPGLSGATVLGDGDVVTILDVETL